MSAKWFVDRSDEYGEGSYESPAGAFEERMLGDALDLEVWEKTGCDRWQLVPVEESGAPCRCGNPKGCGDFLGVDCHADRSEPKLSSELPAEWRALADQ